MPIYKKAGLGGTFDHFHRGHQAFLLFASEQAEHLVVGITTPEMITHKKYHSQIESFETRFAAVKNFTKNFFNKVDVIPLTDPYGPTLTGSNVEVLIATTATKIGAEAVNSKRQELGLTTLPIQVCELEKDSNGQPLASEKIRAGKINRQGKVYKNIFSQNITLTDTQKRYFSHEHGSIVRTPSPSENIFVVGDSSVESFINHHWPYKLGVIDYLKNRKSYSPQLVLDTKTILTIKNAPGEISTEMAEVLEKAINTGTQHIVVDGEEDLAAVALVLLSPLGTHIYYGQPHVGMIEMIVTEQIKEECFKVLSQKD
jgi:cytidyltransferase-like protein